jgi:hypothetical protein
MYSQVEKIKDNASQKARNRSQGEGLGQQPVIQMKRGKRVTRNTKMPWFWGDSLAATWGAYQIPVHKCHSKGVERNALSGGYTIIGKNGIYRDSKVYNVPKPTTGQKKEGHVEHHLIDKMEANLLKDMADDSDVGDDVLALLEIHQWFTPCSGEIGCTNYLMDKINVYNNIYNEVSSGGRFSAEYLYSSGLSESHYLSKHKDKTMKVTDISDDEDFEFKKKEPEVLHKDTNKWG